MDLPKPEYARIGVYNLTSNRFNLIGTDHYSVSLCMFVRLSVSMSVCLSCLSFCMSVCQSK